MSNGTYNYGLEPAGDIVLSMIWGVMIIEFLSVIIVLLSAIVLYKSTKRDGTLQVLLGVAVATFIYVAVSLLESLSYEFMFNEFVTWGFSLAQSSSIFFACIGFLRYSNSYSHES